MFIPYVLVLVSFLGIVALFLKKAPVLAKLPAEQINEQAKVALTSKTVNLIKDKIAHPNYWLAFLVWVEKFLRKVRIVFLRLDNFCISLIASSRERSKKLAIKSRNWVSERRMQKIEKLKLLADLRRTSGDKEEMLLSILKQNPKDIKAYKELGALYLEQENYQDAKSAFEEVLKINPEDEIAPEKLTEIKNLEIGDVKKED
jgi:tetratricopeptide (TPR) repeat protein